jgi:nucleoside diphosphate kinase
MSGGSNGKMVDWGYVLVTADAVLAGRLPWLAERLRAVGLVVHAALVIPYGPRRMVSLYGVPEDSEFYVENKGGEDVTFSVDLHRRLYELSPAVLLIVSRPGCSTMEAVIEVKGSTRPEMSDDGTLRRMGENVIFNLVHAPDDFESACTELTNLLGAEAVARLIDLARPPLEPQLIGIDAALARLPAFSGPAATSFPMIANRIRDRVIQRLWLGGGASDAELATGHTYLAEERAALEVAETSQEKLKQAMAANAAIEAALAAIAERHGAESLQQGLAALAALFDLEGARDHDAVLSLVNEDVYISPLEAIIVESHSYGFRPNVELSGIY